jgi:hypothetical protein
MGNDRSAANVSPVAIWWSNAVKYFLRRLHPMPRIVLPEGTR